MNLLLKLCLFWCQQNLCNILMDHPACRVYKHVLLQCMQTMKPSREETKLILKKLNASWQTLEDSFFLLLPLSLCTMAISHVHESRVHLRAYHAKRGSKYSTNIVLFIFFHFRGRGEECKRRKRWGDMSSCQVPDTLASLGPDIQVRLQSLGKWFRKFEMLNWIC